MLITITIDTDNPAFKDNGPAEVNDMLQKVASCFTWNGIYTTFDSVNIYDSTGTVCGEFKVTETEKENG